MIVSFYSYKGGVGRSQLSANIAAYLFYQKGKRVLLWDWDFEAPGLHYFFGLKNEDITKKGTLELLEDYMATMRKGEDVKTADLKFISTQENVIPLLKNDRDDKTGCIDLLAAGIYNKDFSWRSNNFDWFEFYSLKDGANYIEEIKENLHKLNYDYVLIDSRTGISDYSGICNIQLPDVNVIVVAPTMQNFEGSKSIIEKIKNSEYAKIKNKRTYILPILSRLDYSNPSFTEWVNRFTTYFSYITTSLDEDFDKEFLPEIFADIYFKDTFLPYTPAISAGENILFNHGRTHTRSDFTRPFINIAEFLESIKNNNGISFYKRVDEDSWLEYAQKAKEKGENRKAAIAYTQIGLKQDDPNKKIEFYKEAITLAPQYYLPHYYTGNNYLLKGEFDKAIEHYKKALELRPDYMVAYHSLGLAYGNKSEYDKAIEYFQKAIQLSPNNSDTLMNLGLAYSNKNDYDKAIEYFQKAIELKPSDSALLINLGTAYSNKGAYDKSIEYYEKAIEHGPDLAVAFYNLGIVYFKKNEHAKAIEYFEQATRLDPKDSDNLSSLSAVFIIKGEYDKAIEYALKAISLTPDHTNSFYNLGLAYNGKSEYDQAIGWFKKALELKPNDSSILIDIGVSYANKEDFENAIECSKKAIELKPDDSVSLNNLGFIYLRMGKLSEAEPILRLAVEKGSLENGNMNLGHVYLCRDEKEKALNYYKTSFSNYLNKEKFWKDIDHDFPVLEKHHINHDDFDNMKSKISTNAVQPV